MMIFVVYRKRGQNASFRHPLSLWANVSTLRLKKIEVENARVFIILGLFGGKRLIFSTDSLRKKKYFFQNRPNCRTWATTTSNFWILPFGASVQVVNPIFCFSASARSTINSAAVCP